MTNQEKRQRIKQLGHGANYALSPKNFKTAVFAGNSKLTKSQAKKQAEFLLKQFGL